VGATGLEKEKRRNQGKNAKNPRQRACEKKEKSLLFEKKSNRKPKIDLANEKQAGNGGGDLLWQKK